MSTAKKADLPTIALGPVMPGWGSWEWLGEELIPELSRWYRVVTFHRGEVPDERIVIVIKHTLSRCELERLPQTTKVLFSPVDLYGSASEIDSDARFLRRCDRIIVHCRKLRKYFAPYGMVEELDHHVRFVPEDEAPLHRGGPILWVGAYSNLEPLVAWVNRHRLPRPLIVVTNHQGHSSSIAGSVVGFSKLNDVEIDTWSPERYLKRIQSASAALDIKGDDFRQRHKPPTKAVDFIAAGVPLAMNSDASSVEHLADWGFEVASAEDPAYWLSDEYAAETRRFGRALRELLSRGRIASRLRRIVDAVLSEAVNPGIKVGLSFGRDAAAGVLS